MANVVRYITGRNGTHHVICQVEQGFRVTQFIEGYPLLVGRIERIEEPARTRSANAALKERAIEALQLLPQAPEELGSALPFDLGPVHRHRQYSRHHPRRR